MRSASLGRRQNPARDFGFLYLDDDYHRADKTFLQKMVGSPCFRRLERRSVPYDAGTGEVACAPAVKRALSLDCRDQAHVAASCSLKLLPFWRLHQTLPDGSEYAAQALHAWHQRKKQAAFHRILRTADAGVAADESRLLRRCGASEYQTKPRLAV